MMCKHFPDNRVLTHSEWLNLPINIQNHYCRNNHGVYIYAMGEKPQTPLPTKPKVIKPDTKPDVIPDSKPKNHTIHYFGKVGENIYSLTDISLNEVILKCEVCGVVKTIKGNELSQYKLYGTQSILPNKLREF